MADGRFADCFVRLTAAGLATCPGAHVPPASSSRRRRTARSLAGTTVLVAALAPGLVAVPPVSAAPVPPTPAGLPRVVEALQPYFG